MRKYCKPICKVTILPEVSTVEISDQVLPDTDWGDWGEDGGYDDNDRMY